jgi:hypothetical protein
VQEKDFFILFIDVRSVECTTPYADSYAAKQWSNEQSWWYAIERIHCYQREQICNGPSSLCRNPQYHHRTYRGHPSGEEMDRECQPGQFVAYFGATIACGRLHDEESAPRNVCIHWEEREYSEPSVTSGAEQRPGGAAESSCKYKRAYFLLIQYI